MAAIIALSLKWESNSLWAHFSWTLAKFRYI